MSDSTASAPAPEETAAAAAAAAAPQPKSMATIRLAANDKFKAGDFAAAAVLYEEAAALRSSTGVVETSAAARADEAVKCFGNLCTVYQKLGRMPDAVRCATEAIRIQPAYPKGLAFRGQGEMEAAVKVLNEALDALQHHVERHGVADAPAAVAADDAEDSAAVATPATASLQKLFAACDDGLSGVMEANRWVSAASLLAPTLAAQLKPAHRQYAEVLALYRGVMAAVDQVKAKAKAPAAAAADPDDSDAEHDADDDEEGLFVKLQSGTKWVTAGTGVITSKRTPIGTIVAHLERPLCVGYYAENVGERLCVCCAAVEDPEAPEAKFKTCPTCASVAYCSDKCAAEYAERHTQHECPHMRNLKEMVGHIRKSDREMPDDLAEIASHVITALSALRVHHVDMDLLKSLDDHSDEVTHTLGPVVPLICDLLAFEERRLVTRLCGITRCNAIQVSDATGLGVGQVIFGGFASRFNHSCTPNAALDVDARIIRTIRPIADDTEVTISYTPQLYLPRETRRRILSERYYFTCRCRSCVQSATTVNSDPAILEALVTGIFAGGRTDAEDFFRARAMALAENTRNSDVEDVSTDTLSELTAFMDTVEKHCLPTHYLLQELRNAAVFAASVVGNKADVAKYAQQEAWLWELLVPGALPVKSDKLRNWLIATEGDAATNAEAQEARSLVATVSDFYSAVA